MTTLNPASTPQRRPTPADRDADVTLDAHDRLADTGPEFDGCLSKLGPMAVDALVHLGGATAVTGRVAASRRRLMPAPPTERPIDVIRSAMRCDWWPPIVLDVERRT